MSWQERAGRLICIGIGVFGGYWAWRLLAGALLPFGIAALIALALSPLAAKLASFCRLPKAICAVVLVVMTWLLAGLVLSGVIKRFISEAEALLALGLTGESIKEGWLGLCARLPSGWRRVLEGFLEEAWAEALWNKLTSTVSGILTSAVGRLLGGTPTALLNLLVTVLASFYLTVSGDKLFARLRAALPRGLRERITRLRPSLRRAAGGYVRAVCLLFLLTFGEVFVGLLILRRRYALLCALCVAAVDILPVLGSGTVLLPWAALLFLQGQTSTALGMLILYGVITVVRQLAEPHLVGESLGLPPVVSLFGMVAGLRLFGVAGLLLCPVALSLIWRLMPGAEDAVSIKKSGEGKKHLDRREGV